MRRIYVDWILCFVCVISFSLAAVAEDRIDLSGQWRLRLDPNNAGVGEEWFNENLPERILLPGTTDQAKVGYPLRQESMDYEVSFVDSDWPGKPTPERIDQAGHLVRPYLYIGTAWYQRDIEIPAEWKDKHLKLRLERVLWKSEVWIDNRSVGACDSLVAAHRFDLGQLSPGVHRLTIAVDNDLQCNIGILGHAYGPETQSRWNGIVGAIKLLAVDPVYIEQMRIFPAADRRSVRVEIRANNTTAQTFKGLISLEVQSEKGNDSLGKTSQSVNIEPGQQKLEKIVTLDKPAESWDEFNTTRYRLVSKLTGDNIRHEKTEIFGFRNIERDGRYIRINDRRIFLRGTLDCAVYPKTGHPPMNVAEWLLIFRAIKEHGFNHVRYHTWCPPEAAFEAADRMGIYLCPETPYWVDYWTIKTGTKPLFPGMDAEVVEYVRNEIRRISDAYGNHPSFAFFCIGNEFSNKGSDWDAINSWLAQAKQYDPRRLYNATTARKRVEADDFWVTHTTGSARTRGTGPSHTNWDFSKAAESVDLPIVAHETGQRPVFPDYDDFMPKFDGPLKPLNYERFRKQLHETGIFDQAGDFERASARFQYVQYKAEHEAMLRTKDYAGYQLLMLNDFTGQSEALVGILDPFWEPKGIISAAEVRKWNNSTVPLARFDKYTWGTSEEFEAIFEVAHYGPKDLKEVNANWKLVTCSGSKLAGGALGPFDIPTGGVTSLGGVTASLNKVSKASKLILSIELADVQNEWNIWVYPAGESETTEVAITSDIEEALAALAGGGRVLLLAHGIKSAHAAKTGFFSVYWSAGWWGNKYSTLGILSDPNHPALKLFPNDGHSDWQWHQLADSATTFVLEEVPRGFRPIVQPVTDFHFNKLLAQLFEARVGKGSLMVCGYDLAEKLGERHAARQFRAGLLDYMQSGDFKPRHEFSVEYLKSILGR